MSETIYLSVVIPVYNEEKRLGPTLDAVMAFLKKQPYSSEIIVADDGSRDESLKIAGERLKGFPHQIVQNPVNQGKGAAVKRGMLAAHGSIRLFSDADLSTPIEEVSKFIQHHVAGNDVVIGSRALEASNVTQRQNPLREAMGRIFNKIARLMAFEGIQDSQCGFKSFNRRAAMDLFGLQKLNGFSFDAEIMYLAQVRGYKILESPVTWVNDTQSRVRLFRDPLLMFRDLLRIRRLHRDL